MSIHRIRRDIPLLVGRAPEDEIYSVIHGSLVDELVLFHGLFEPEAAQFISDELALLK